MSFFEPDIRTSRSERMASAIIAGWIRLCRRTIRWERHGEQELIGARAQGPVLFVFWHSRLFMASALLPPEALPLVNLFAVNRDGRISAGVQSRFGLRPIGLSGKGGERAAARAALGALRDGFSIAVPGDNSRQGARRLGTAPLEWARASGVPVFIAANAVRRQWRLPGWDRMLFPFPFSRGAVIYRRWEGELPRRPSEAEREAAHASLTAALDATTAEADALVGLKPGP